MTAQSFTDTAETPFDRIGERASLSVQALPLFARSRASRTREASRVWGFIRVARWRRWRPRAPRSRAIPRRERHLAKAAGHAARWRQPGSRENRVARASPAPHSADDRRCVHPAAPLPQPAPSPSATGHPRLASSAVFSACSHPALLPSRRWYRGRTASPPSPATSTASEVVGLVMSWVRGWLGRWKV